MNSLGLATHLACNIQRHDVCSVGALCKTGTLGSNRWLLTTNFPTRLPCCSNPINPRVAQPHPIPFWSCEYYMVWSELFIADHIGALPLREVRACAPLLPVHAHLAIPSCLWWTPQKLHSPAARLTVLCAPSVLWERRTDAVAGGHHDGTSTDRHAAWWRPLQGIVVF